MHRRLPYRVTALYCRSQCRMAAVALLAVAATAMLAFLACGPKVMVPPNVDLGVFESIALIDFTSNAEGNLAGYATQKFLEVVTASQPEARLIEVGTEEEVLARLGIEKMNLDAIKAIAEEYGVDGVITGDLTVSDVKPHVNISPDLGALEFGQPPFVAGAVLRPIDLAGLTLECLQTSADMAECTVGNLPLGRKLPEDFFMISSIFSDRILFSISSWKNSSLSIYVIFLDSISLALYLLIIL